MAKRIPKPAEEEVQPEQAQTAAPAASLTLQDLVLVAQIIQLTTQRGAFRAEELANVGGLYNKLITFLQASGALTPPSEASTEETN